MQILHNSIYKQMVLIVAIVSVWGSGTKSLAQSGVSNPNQLLNPPIVKQYQLTCEYLSLDPNQPIASYRDHGSSALSVGATVGGFYKDDIRCFQTLITSQLKDDRFLVQIRVTPESNDTITQGQTIDLDLSDLQARSVELARNDDGRIYWINMTPSIKIINRKAKPLQESALRLTQWNLVGSPVVINDTTYAGNMNVSGGAIAFVDYQTIGRIDFSLVPFKGAEPSGILFSGCLKLRHQDQNVDIYGVQNGSPAMRLPGGPYTIWAKWSPATANQQMPEMPSSVEEFMQLIKGQFAEKGLTPPDDDELQASYEQLKGMKRLPLSCGVRGISKSEWIE